MRRARRWREWLLGADAGAGELRRAWARTRPSAADLAQMRRDYPRTVRHIPHMDDDAREQRRVFETMGRFVTRHPSIGYLQGMLNLLVPIHVVTRPLDDGADAGPMFERLVLHLLLFSPSHVDRAARPRWWFCARVLWAVPPEVRAALHRRPDALRDFAMIRWNWPLFTQSTRTFVGALHLWDALLPDVAARSYARLVRMNALMWTRAWAAEARALDAPELFARAARDLGVAEIARLIRPGGDAVEAWAAD